MSFPSVGRRIFREPLAQFAVVATGLVALAVLRPASPPAERILITPQVVDDIVRRHSELIGRSLSEPERRQAVESAIDEEVLLREALRQGLELRDPQVRRELVRRMRFGLEDEATEPTDADLEVFYRQNLDRYRTQPSSSLEHAFFSAERAAEIEEAGPILERLRGGVDPEAVGDPYWIGSRLRKYSRTALVREFGEGFAQAVETATLLEWFGPIRSPRGSHFLRVMERHEREQVPYEEVSAYLREDWILLERSAAVARKLKDLRQGYRIVIEAEPEEGR